MQQKTILLVTLCNFYLNFAIQSSLILLPIYGAQLGASNFQIGLIGAYYGFAFLLASIYSGRQSDRLGRLGFVHTGLFLCAITYTAQILAHDLSTLYIVRAAVGLSQGITVAALVAYAYEAGADMGKFSAYGSLGWIGGAVAEIFIQGFNGLFIISALCAASAFAISLFFPKQIVDKIAQRKESPRYLTVIKQGFPIYLSVFLRHLGATSVWIILPLYFESLGLGRSWVGALWAINFIAQFIVMRFLERFNPYKVFAIGQVISIVVFASYAVLHTIYPLIIVQIFLGVAWACLYVGALMIVLKMGEDRGTASGMFQATINLCGALGPFIGGTIAQFWGYRGVMWFAVAIGLAGMLVAVPQAKAHNSQNSSTT